MRRRRRLPGVLLNAATVVSLALLVATVVLWTRSRAYLDRLTALNWRRGELAFLSARGGFSVIVQRRDEFMGDPYEPHDAPLWSVRFSFGHDAGYGIDEPSLWGFRRETMRVEWVWEHAHGSYRNALWSLSVPYWALVILLAVPASLGVAHATRRRRRRYARLLCPTCGYDLRATPERCPECGHITKRDGPAHARTAG